MREIVFDTETTGLSYSAGHRLVEIGCVELINRVPTGRHFHRYVNPDRDMPVEAFAVHGLSEAFLADKPRFHEICDELIEFLGDCPLIAHNAMFDLGFMNGELKACGRAILTVDRIVDTLQIARTKHPGAKHTLDALCVRYGVDLSARELHGALLDAQLLAQVFIELTGGRQIALGLAVGETTGPDRITVASTKSNIRPARIFTPSAEELARHSAFMAGFEDPVWGTAASG
ncbi:DNA polymerase III subunit epsilon [Sphingomonas sp.]|jgi:DNA polymerase-3 subunit epsilon|uniref:DNA polymerase III subunit epsilon n=1 Tax=Sphingomonas sp. TaxID=28214 RepID=UPI002E0F9684|nr:DNA polymerase III subunit epsilon [Sphingomonas sp.]HEV7287324.1 DNA polymerase III subunit epsilon [Sphingomonas sp.]